MSGKLGAYLDLVRIPNVFTAVADIVAGFLYVGGGPGGWRVLLLLAGASSCLYAGGAALNDVCDVERDTRERPNRPIPSGRVSRRAALRLAVGLLTVGFGLAAIVSGKAAILAALLVASIVLYDSAEPWDRHSNRPNDRLESLSHRGGLAAALMGLCRALNLTLGMSCAPELWSGMTVVPAALIWLYTASVTFFARHEACMDATGGLSASEHGQASSQWHQRGPLLAGTIGVCLAVGGLASLCWIVPGVDANYLGLVAVLGLTLGYHGAATVLGGPPLQRWGKRIVARFASPTAKAMGHPALSPQPVHVQRTVKILVVSLIAFDTCIAWAPRGPLAALAVAITIIPTVILGRAFRVT